MMVKLRNELDNEIQSLQEQFAAAEEEYRKSIDPKVAECQKAYEADAMFFLFHISFISFDFQCTLTHQNEHAESKPPSIRDYNLASKACHKRR
jgi:hypothetical protein